MVYRLIASIAKPRQVDTMLPYRIFSRRKGTVEGGAGIVQVTQEAAECNLA